MVKSIIGEVVSYEPSPAYQVKTDGVSTNTRKYYHFGGNNVALRENGTLTWLLTDHLNSTALTANEDGSLASEIRYTAFGEVRTANGVTVTDNKYTGQPAVQVAAQIPAWTRRLRTAARPDHGRLQSRVHEPDARQHRNHRQHLRPHVVLRCAGAHQWAVGQDRVHTG